MDGLDDKENEKNNANVNKGDLFMNDSEDERFRKEIIETYYCSICLLPPQQSCVCPCGHIFCQPCLMKWLYSLSDANCPKCRSYFKVEEILNLRNGYFTKANQFDTPPKIKILRPGFSAQSIKHSNLIIYQVDNKKPAFKSIAITTALFYVTVKLLNYIL